MTIGYSWYMALKEIEDRSYVSRNEMRTILSNLNLPESTTKTMTKERLIEGSNVDSGGFAQGYVLGALASVAMEEYKRNKENDKKATRATRAAWWAVVISTGSLLIAISNSGWFYQLVSLISK